jgi:hypothetical protein
MMMNGETREEIETLLPWFAAGTLSRKDAARVESALKADAVLSRHYELVREELAETIRLNETLGAPSSRAMARLFEKIEAESPSESRAAVAPSLTSRIFGFVESLSPRTLALSGAAAALAILLQAGIIAGVVLNERGDAGYRTVGVEQAAPSGQGSFVLVRFAPQASAADITKVLEDHKASIVFGPTAGGVYQVRIATTALPKEETARIVKSLQDNKAIGFAAPAP